MGKPELKSDPLPIITYKLTLYLLNIAAFAIDFSSGNREELTLIADVLSTTSSGPGPSTVTRGDSNGDRVTVITQPKLFELLKDSRVVWCV
jgi:hypothetical protein